MCLFLRSSLIPGIVIFLQKLLRGALARKLYKRMVAARYCRVQGLWTVYIEYQSFRPFVGIGSSKRVCLPPWTHRGNSNTRLRVRGWGTQFRRLDRKPGTLYFSIVSDIFPHSRTFF
jgi:hypothetical protein